MTGSPSYGYGDWLALSVSCGVRQKIHHDLLDPVRIPMADHGRLELELHGTARGCGLPLHLSSDVPHERRELDFLDIEGCRSGAETRHQKDVVEQLGNARKLALRDPYESLNLVHAEDHVLSLRPPPQHVVVEELQA